MKGVPRKRLKNIAEKRGKMTAAPIEIDDESAKVPPSLSYPILWGIMKVSVLFE